MITTIMKFKNPFRRKFISASDAQSGSGSTSSSVTTDKADGRKLGDLHALVLIGAMFMLPIGLLSYDMLQEHDKQITFAEKELRGADYVAALREMQQQLLRHRGLVDRVLG